MKKCIVLMLILASILTHTGCQASKTQATTPSTFPPTQSTTLPPTQSTTLPTTQAPDPNAIPMGTILITQALQQALDATDDENEEFAVVVSAMPGTTKDHVYNTFVAPLNIQEDYQKWGILYLTKAQIQAAVCPADYWLVFMLGSATYSGMPITPETLHRIKTETREVQITYDTTGYTSDQYPQLQKAICDAYGITEEMVTFSSKTFHRFQVILDTALLAPMLEDGRILWIDDKGPFMDPGNGGGGTPSRDAKSPVISIRCLLDENWGYGYDMAVENIYTDGNTIYSLGGMYANRIIVYYLDGTTETIKAALASGRATIENLDQWGIEYFTSEKPE